MDPISLVIGAVLLAGGFFAGRISKRRGGQDKIVAVCGCGHGLDKHDPKDGTCHSEETRARYEDGHWQGQDYVRCTCRQYVGPKPIEELFAPKYLPPTD